MGYWSTINRDIKLDSNYGDFEINGGDLVFVQNKIEILKNVIIERFKTNNNDFKLNPNYGADLERYIGKGVDHKVKESIETSFRYALTYDGLLDSDEIDIVIIQLQNILKIYIYVRVEDEQVRVVEATYNQEEFSFD